jgi:hypothetical protein
VAQAVFAPAEADNALGFEPDQRRLADFAVEDVARMGDIAKQEWDIEDAEFGGDGGW